MLKRLAKSVFRQAGFELCKLSSNEIAAADTLGLDTNSLNYKEVQAIRAIAAPGHITLEEARFLGELIRRTDPTQPIVEIGTLFGFSTRFIALYKSPHQSLTSVDLFAWNPLGLSAAAHEAATRAALKDITAHENVRIVRADKDRFYADYSGPPPGLFFCDADHGYEATLADLQWAKRVGANIICGHDYLPGVHDGVVKAVQELGGPRELVGSLFVV